jgi:serine/threonine-protein kinase
MTPMADSHIATGPTLASPGRGNPIEPDRPIIDRLVEGDAVGDYVVERFLGAGAMGEVYAGRHPVINKRVAIKVLKRELASDKEAAERFVREARAVNQIDHPNVIDVFNFGQLKGDDGRLYLVMDLVDGQSLRRVLEDGPLPIDEALDILDQIADALDTAHARGVVHRDLKPDNVMLSSGHNKPKIFVLDFGIAKLFTATVTGSGAIGNGTLTGKGTWLGTPGYMAPEQWSAEGAGPASDRYALGVMAYELLSGTLPFKAPTLPQMMEQHFRSPVPALSQRGTTRKPPEHHQTLDPVLARAMAKSPDDRFPTGRALVDALRAASKGRAVVAPVASGKRSLAMPAVAGASVLGLAVVGFIVVRPGNDDGDSRERPNASASTEQLVKLEVITRPAKAKVRRDGQLLGETPVAVEVPAGAKLTLAISKPGYRAISDTLTADKAVSLVKDLQPVVGYEGVWQMPDGKLRGFWRNGERVGVYRLETVTGDRELWRTCELEDAPSGSDAVVFATTAEMTDERAHHGDAGCAIPHRIEYRFDPTAESLEVSAEKVETARRNGSCVVVSRAPGPPIKLARADRGNSDTRITQPPVGRTKESDAVKVPNDSFDNLFDKSKRIPLDDKKNIKAPPAKPAPKPVTKPAPPKADVGKQIKSDLGKPIDAANQADDVTPPPVQKKAPPAKNAKEPPIQKSQAPIQPTPQAQAPAPRGDSQQAQAPRGDSQQAK